jgi:hypothetical protein
MPKLVSLSIEETSGVDHPAHLREGWMVMKSANESEVSAVLDQIKAASGHPDKLEAKMPEENIEVEVEATDELAKANERIAELEAALAAQVASVEEVAAVDADEELLKSVPEAFRKMLEDQKAVITEALAKAASTEDELRKERAARADEAAIAKAASWSSLSIDANEVGPALRRLADTDADLAKSIESVLDGANAQAESASIFAEIGKSGRPDTGDAYESLASLAKSAVDAGISPTFEQAFVKVAEQNPDLYHRHLTEKA